MCSHDMRIQNVVTRWPGGTEVNHIFNSSQAKNRFESGEFNDGLILGGSNYRLSNKLLTPITKPVSLTDELYNAAHIHTQNVVERCVRLLQSRFPLLMRCLRCDIKLTQRIIVAATILHNIAIENGDDEPTTDISKKQLDESSDESSSSKFLHDSHNESSEVKNKEKDVYRTRNEIIKYFDDLSQKQIDR